MGHKDSEVSDVSSNSVFLLLLLVAILGLHSSVRLC